MSGTETFSSITEMPGLWRSFSTIVANGTTPAQSALLQAQIYAVAQTQAMALPPQQAFSGTYTWATPQMLSALDASGANIWVARNYSAQDGGNGVTDPLATAWQSSWATAPLAASMIAAPAFIALFTPAEQAAVVAVAQTTASIAQLIEMLEGAGLIDLTQAEVTSGMADLVAAGAITQARASTILTVS